jgi:hypothetical protein
MPVGGFTNCPEGIPVIRADATPDPEVIRVADDQLGAEGPALLEVLQEDPVDGPVLERDVISQQ